MIAHLAVVCVLMYGTAAQEDSQQLTGEHGQWGTVDHSV